MKLNGGIILTYHSEIFKNAVSSGRPDKIVAGQNVFVSFMRSQSVYAEEANRQIIPKGTRFPY